MDVSHFSVPEWITQKDISYGKYQNLHWFDWRVKNHNCEINTMDDKVITHKSLLITLWEKVFKNLKNEHLLLSWNQNCFLFIKQRTSYCTLLVTLTLNKLSLIHPHCHQCDQPFLLPREKLLPNYPNCSECWTNNDRNALNLWNTFHPQMQNTSRTLHIHAITRPFWWSWGRRKHSIYAFYYIEKKKLKFAEVKYSWAMKRWKYQGLLPWTAHLSNSVVSQWLDDDSRKGVVHWGWK